MSKHDLMKDPFYAQLIFIVESVICKADSEAQKKGIRLTDSNIKSALNKSCRVTPQRVVDPAMPIESRDGIIEELALSISAHREFLAEENEDGSESKEVSPADWVKAISAVEASLKIRKSNEPGGRDYLDYVRTFIASASV